MELGKQGSSGTSSSEENDIQDHHHHSRRQEVVQKEEKITNSSPSGATTKRFYECSYCKKGFDNAQALGGHMNIHRGAKAKAKQARTATPNSSITTIKSNEEYLNPSYGNVGPRSGFYHMYFQPSGSVPGQNYGYNYQYGAEFLVPRPTSSLNVNGELWGSNLSLRIGSGRGQESEVDARGVAKEDEVDLELRLGHHDRY